ncbi:MULTISPECIES: DUF6888 family protein [Microcystis]|uniref:DUF6888 domain-containing protein n=1 Tax=Microcystis aeruginosa (strain NIES-843 / IAM M-2473) TaxID=449447 RepID=B0JN97_MICAN|nr:hypothetical protein MAE_04390 [Microcystis aeruginosa NIES-843]
MARSVGFAFAFISVSKLLKQILYFVIISVIRSVLGGKNIPTLAQLLQCYTLSCWATRFYLPINLIRLDERTKNIFMLIGEGIEIEIKPNGQWIK